LHAFFLAKQHKKWLPLHRLIVTVIIFYALNNQPGGVQKTALMHTLIVIFANNVPSKKPIRVPIAA